MNQIYDIKTCLFLVIIAVSSMTLSAQVLDKSWRHIVNKKDDGWFASSQARAIAENVLLYQRNIGGWPKNIQMQLPLTAKQKQDLLDLKDSTDDVTTDNGATTQEMVFLSKMYRQTQDERFKKAFLWGLNYILEAQYENGGWPQFYPLRKGYYSHITYNDDSMVNILKLLKHLKDGTNKYSIKPDNETIIKIKAAFNKGIDCILKTQYKQNGVLTAWCAQHDEKTLEPAKARAYELPSLSGKESAQIVLLLMSIENPSKEIITSITSAVAWFEKVKINGLRKEQIYNDVGKIINKRMIPDQSAPAIWARFMELEDNTPFFCDRDGVKKASLLEIGEERRNGYAWYTNEPQKLLEKYPEWERNYLKSTKEKVEDKYMLVVAQDGSGDFISIQEAINASKAFPYQRVVINIKDGKYKEKVHVYSWNTHISLIGESKENTIITYDDYFDKINLGRNSTFHTATLLVEGNDFIAKNITIQNISGEVGQAVALSVNANRVYFENCSILGYQDTVYAAGEGFRQYFKNCYIEGSTDFIFGEATVLFDSCELHSKTNSYITAASTPRNQKYGFVFKNCKLTADKSVNEVYLGRPWRNYAKTVFVNCNMGAHIKPEGWHNWNKKEAESTTFFAEYNCIGEGNKPKSRVGWSHQLKKNEARKYIIENILKSNKENSKWYQK